VITINNRDKLDWTPEMTVRDMLDKMGYIYVLITVTVNDELVDDEDYNTYLIPDNADVKAIHIHHGG